MNNYVISCCSPVDYAEEDLKALDVETIFFHIILDGKDYLDDFGKSLSAEELLDAQRAGRDVKTSQISVGEYKDFFRPFLEQGRDILHVTVSSGLSGTLNSANLAARHMMEEFPERKVIVVDSRGGSCGYGMLVEQASIMRKEGKNIEEVRDWLEEHRLEVAHYFFSHDLTHFIKGGRIPRYVGILAQKMKICPVMVGDADGRIVMSDKIRTKKKAMIRAVERIGEMAIGGYNYTGKIMMSHTDPEMAEDTAALIREKFPHISDLKVRPLGVTFSSHSGPGCVALFYWCKTRTNQ